MSIAGRRFVAKAIKKVGWRVWDNVQHRFWGPVFAQQPEAVLAELNGAKRGSELTNLVASAPRPDK